MPGDRGYTIVVIEHWYLALFLFPAGFADGYIVRHLMSQRTLGVGGRLMNERWRYWSKSFGSGGEM